jgi:hypothetical protein
VNDGTKDSAEDDSKGSPDENSTGCLNEQPLILDNAAAKTAIANKVFTLRSYGYWRFTNRNPADKPMHAHQASVFQWMAEMCRQKALEPLSQGMTS